MRNTSHEWCHDVLQSIADPIIAIDSHGRVKLLNPAAEALTGWKLEQACGKPLAEVLRMVNEETCVEVEKAVDRVLREGSVVSLPRHALLIARDGTERPIAGSGAPIRNETGEIIGVALVCRDHTAEHATQQALWESENRYRSLFENMLEGYAYCKVLFDHGEPQDFVYLVVNNAFEKLTGLQNVVGKKVSEILPGIKESNPELFEIYGRVASTGKSERFETYIEHLGSWFSIEAFSPGKEYFIAVFDNVTGRKKADEALQLFRTLIDQSNDIIEVVDPKTGRFLDVNDKGCLDLGYRREEYLALSVFDVDPLVSPSSFTRSSEELRQSGVLLWEGLHRRKDGSTFPVEVNIKYVQLSRGYIVAVVRDVTARKRAEQALQESEERFQRLSEATLEGIVIHEKGQILDANPSLAAMFGYELSEIIGKNALTLAAPESHDLIRQNILSGYEEPYEAIGLRKDGSTFVVELVGKAIPYHGRLVRVAAIRDITERKRAEEERGKLEKQFQQAQKMEAIGQLAGGVAHDFNNILTVISGYSEILLSALPSTDPQRRFIEDIYQAGKRAASLICQLLAFSRQTVLVPKVVDLNDVVRETERMLRRLIGEDIRLTMVLDPLISRVKVDPDQLGQVLMNLAVNARDAMPQGGNLSLETHHTELDETYWASHPDIRPGRYVLVTMTDSGCGMTPEIKARLFEPFFTTKGPGKGTGLGLAVVYGIVKQSGGSIEVYSEVGHGTTFKLYFPAVEQSAFPLVEDPFATTASYGTETVLLVEDEEPVRALALLALEMNGYKVVVASNGKEALQIAAIPGNNFDLLVTDVVMPEIGGRELAQEMQSLHPKLKILYVSGYTDDVVVLHGLLHAEVAFLPKPYTPLILAKKVREVLDGKQ